MPLLIKPIGTTLDWSWNLSSLRCSTQGNSCNFSISTAPPMASLTSLIHKTHYNAGTFQISEVLALNPEVSQWYVSIVCQPCICIRIMLLNATFCELVWDLKNEKECHSFNISWFPSLFVVTSLHAGYTDFLPGQGNNLLSFITQWEDRFFGLFH